MASIVYKLSAISYQYSAKNSFSEGIILVLLRLVGKEEPGIPRSSYL
jgi:hypothetical protein